MELFRRSRTQIFGRIAGRFLCRVQAVNALPLEVQRELELAVPAEDLLFSLAKLGT